MLVQISYCTKKLLFRKYFIFKFKKSPWLFLTYSLILFFFFNFQMYKQPSYKSILILESIYWIYNYSLENGRNNLSEKKQYNRICTLNVNKSATFKSCKALSSFVRRLQHDNFAKVSFFRQSQKRLLENRWPTHETIQPIYILHV